MATLTRSDVQSVERKLRKFSSDLPEQERNVLGWLVSRAKSASSTAMMDEDHQAAGNQDLATALGFNDESITVSWSKSFAN
jgi:hypothetical protein